MKKPIAPEVLALIPNGIDNFCPHCVVCTQELPEKRRRAFRRPTCSPTCHAAWLLYKKFLLSSTKCIACWAPSTPSERLLFREWRQAQGKLRRTLGRPRKPATDPFAEVPEPESATFSQQGIDSAARSD